MSARDVETRFSLRRGVGVFSAGCLIVLGSLRFPEERYEHDGETRVLRSVWRFEGADTLIAVTEELRDGRWAEAWRIVHRRE